MTKLVVHLLGGYRVELGGEAVYDFETDKARALLAYLMVEADRPHRREALAGLLWPDRPESVARTNLRQALARVRRALSDYTPPHFLFVTSTDVQFNTASDYTLDADELEAFASCPGGRRQLLPAAFCADFLDGFAMPDSETFEEWALSRQEHYHRLALETLDAQNATFEAIGEYDQALAAARLQLKLEPWLEEAHRRCMRALALAGRRDEALHQFEACRRALQAELGVEPAASTLALYADILAEKIAACQPSPAVNWGKPAEPSRLPGAPAHPARLVAREDALGRLSRALQATFSGQTQVVFVGGDAGSGKTMLLETFAASAMAAHPGLLVAGARCSPGGGRDPFALLRKLAEMLCGDLANHVAWRLANTNQLERLQRATDLVLASLTAHGLSLVDTLVPAASLARRAGFSSPGVKVKPAAWWGALESRPQIALAPGASPAWDTLFDQLISTVAAVAREQPLLLLFDDLQWVDEASATFLAHVGRVLTDSRIFILGAYRSATVALGRRTPEGGDGAGEVRRHPLAPVLNELRRIQGDIVIDLDQVDGRAFVEELIDTEPNRLGSRFRDALYAQTGGQALFTVELLRNLQERGELVKDEAGRWTVQESLDWGPLPARVEGAIAERIERLSAGCRRILACASVQGDDFSGEVTAMLAGAPVHVVLACLSDALGRQHHLVRPEGTQHLGSGQLSMYRFRHHLFQKYVYEQLDTVERAQMHAALARALEEQAASNPLARERISARLAWHYELAELPLQAACALHDAGRQAMRVSAYHEALNRFEHALELLAQAPPSPERTEIERLLEIARLGPQRIAEGPASAHIADIWAHAAETRASDAQGRPQLMLLEAQAERLAVRGQFEASLAVTGRMLALATKAGDQAFIAVAHFLLGFVYNLMGDPQAAEAHFNNLLGTLTPERRLELRAAIGSDIATPTLAFSALNQWWLGHPEQALARSREAAAIAREQSDTYGQAVAYAIGATVLFLLRDEGTALREHSELCHRLCAQQGYAMWRVYAEVFLGWLAVNHGNDDSDVLTGIEQMRKAIADWHAMGMAVGTDVLVLVLVDGCLAAWRRQVRDGALGDQGLAIGLAAVDGLLGPQRMPCGQSYTAELLRLRGELLLARDGLTAAPEALVCFHNALACGREKGALAWELRAAMSLVQLREQQQEPGTLPAVELEDARACLRKLYERYGEGFSIPDLRDAAAMLARAAVERPL